MEHMEECMGGQHPGFAFDLDTYAARMLAYDAEVDSELQDGDRKVCKCVCGGGACG